MVALRFRSLARACASPRLIRLYGLFVGKFVPMKAGPLIGPSFVSRRLNFSFLLALSASLALRRESSGCEAAEMSEKSDVAGVDELMEVVVTEADAIEDE